MEEEAKINEQAKLKVVIRRNEFYVAASYLCLFCFFYYRVVQKLKRGEQLGDREEKKVDGD
jgi:hypothetical protein